ncbi:hypothetical protein [Novosphingobium sp.]|uniref:hypothetical protein n=1 Tax=Novosphingobium sp. TaxID=1874826 RepID=UPI00286C9CC1|nr:hypothetical protein [Novosphingobium sp.]
MNIFGGITRAGGALALMLALVPVPAPAQDTPVFSVPTARPTANPRAQGPVDDDNPVVRATPRPAPSAVATFTPVPVPTIAPSKAAPQPRPGTAATPGRAPAPRTAQPANAQPVTAARTDSVAPGTAAAPAIDPLATPTITAEGATPAALPSDAFALPSASDDAPAAPSGWYWPWLAGAATLLAALFGILWWRRRKPVTAVFEFEPPVVRQPSPQPQPSPPAPQPVAAPVAAPLPAAANTGALTITLEARRMSASLMATTLSYALTLTNTTDQALTALAVEGDMIAAHGSLPAEQQIAGDTQRLELRHALVTLGPGESAEFIGDFRLPLATLVPIRAGDAALFVPLARLRIEASTAAGIAVVQVKTWVVGELPEQPGAALRPFRLDLGPRTYSRVGQKAVG